MRIRGVYSYAPCDKESGTGLIICIFEMCLFIGIFKISSSGATNLSTLRHTEAAFRLTDVDCCILGLVEVFHGG